MWRKEFREGLNPTGVGLQQGVSPDTGQCLNSLGISPPAAEQGLTGSQHTLGASIIWNKLSRTLILQTLVITFIRTLICYFSHCHSRSPRLGNMETILSTPCWPASWLHVSESFLLADDPWSEMMLGLMHANPHQIGESMYRTSDSTKRLEGKLLFMQNDAIHVDK
jgi:hypothetical protein